MRPEGVCRALIWIKWAWSDFGLGIFELHLVVAALTSVSARGDFAASDTRHVFRGHLEAVRRVMMLLRCSFIPAWHFLLRATSVHVHRRLSWSWWLHARSVSSRLLFFLQLDHLLLRCLELLQQRGKHLHDLFTDLVQMILTNIPCQRTKPWFVADGDSFLSLPNVLYDANKVISL